jgi:hypothetical protein
MALASHYKKRFSSGEMVFFQIPGQPCTGPHEVTQVISDGFASQIGKTLFAQQGFYPAAVNYPAGYYCVLNYEVRIPLPETYGLDIYDYLIPQHMLKKVCQPSEFKTCDDLLNWALAQSPHKQTGE